MGRFPGAGVISPTDNSSALPFVLLPQLALPVLRYKPSYRLEYSCWSEHTPTNTSIVAWLICCHSYSSLVGSSPRYLSLPFLLHPHPLLHVLARFIEDASHLLPLLIYRVFLLRLWLMHEAQGLETSCLLMSKKSFDSCSINPLTSNITLQILFSCYHTLLIVETGRIS